MIIDLSVFTFRFDIKDPLRLTKFCKGTLSIDSVGSLHAYNSRNDSGPWADTISEQKGYGLRSEFILGSTWRSIFSHNF